MSKQLTVDIQDLQSNLSNLRSENITFQHTISELQTATVDLESAIQMKDASMKRKDSELESKNKAIEEKDATITAMSEQITKTREYLATKQQALQASVTLKQCANLPVGINNVRSTVISGKVYCGGTTNNDDDAFFVYCYDISQGEWTTLLPLPVKWFGLGQVNGKLVAVGGRKKSNYDETNEVHTYDKRSQKWKQTIPPMSTARWSAGVLSLQSALVVAGGRTSYYTSAVEIFKPDTSQWYRTDPLPTACVHIALVALGNTLYALGGYKDLSPLNQALSASVDDLLGNALPANQTAQSGSSDTQSAWKSLPDTPTYGPAAAVFAGNLLAVGGYKEAPLDLVVSPGIKEIYMYSPSTNSWIYISDLPAPRSRTTVSVLSSTEVLVIGGWADDRVNTVYKGTLTVS